MLQRATRWLSLTLLVALTPGTASTPVSVLLTTSSPTAIFGEPLALTAAVAPVSASGLVTFYDGVAVLGTARLLRGTAHLSAPPPASGRHALSAFYQGDVGFSPATSPPVVQHVQTTPAFGNFPIMEYPTGISDATATGDLNRDGKPDLVFVSPSEKDIAILLGNGDGTFTPAPLLASSPPAAILIADFNNDGHPDLALLFAVRTLDIFLGHGDGTFFRGPTSAAAPASSRVGTLRLTSADFNRDGIVDLAIVGSTINDTSASLNVLLGNGDGSFLPPSPFPAGVLTQELVAADFNGDGAADIAVLSVHDGIHLFLNSGDGTLSPPILTPLSQTISRTLVVADFNEDGKPDLAVSQSRAPANTGIRILTGLGTGRFSTGSLYIVPDALPTSFIVAEDFNGDGHFDLALHIYGTSLARASQHLALGNGDGTFRPSFLAFRPQYVSTALAADFDGDGRVDLAVHNGVPSALAVHLAIRSPDLSVATTFIPSGMSGVPYTRILFAGGGAPPYTGWALARGTLPPGLTLSPAGILSGTPLTHQGSPFAFSVTVQDPTGETSSPRSLTLTLMPPIPAIAPYGVTPVYGRGQIIQAGSWASIVGTNLAPGTVIWNGDYPTTLGGVTVGINGQKAYLSYVSPTQINLQVPDTARLGGVPVVVTSAFGTAFSSTTLATYSPSLFLLPGTGLVQGIIPALNGAGAWANGAYDLVGPGTLPNYSTRPVHPGETLILYGTGFGPTWPPVPAGKPLAVLASPRIPWAIRFGTVQGTVVSILVVAPGVYQFTVVVPQLKPGLQYLYFSNFETSWSGPTINVQ